MAKNEQLKIAIERIKINTGLKQAEIADKLDIKSTYLSDMINGRVPLTESVCQKIFELFHISILEDKLEEITFREPALTLGIPAEVIMRWTGHADLKAMKPYIKIVDDLKKQEMSKFDDMFTPKKGNTDNAEPQ